MLIGTSYVDIAEIKYVSPLKVSYPRAQFVIYMSGKLRIFVKNDASECVNPDSVYVDKEVIAAVRDELVGKLEELEKRANKFK